jgi:hypothetical protein
MMQINVQNNYLSVVIIHCQIVNGMNSWGLKKMAVFSDVALYILVENARRFRGSYYLQHQGDDDRLSQ